VSRRVKTRIGCKARAIYMRKPKAICGALAVLLSAEMNNFLPVYGGGRPQASPKVNTSLIYSVKGQDLFRAYCAACHGADGTGDGPVAPALKAKPPDLTQLRKNSNGKFPSDRVRATIAGEDVVKSHGSREMPVWGPIFHQIDYDQDLGNVRIENLVKYLESIQKK